MRVFFLITVALILYGSLYPFHFIQRSLPYSPLVYLLRSWPPLLLTWVFRDALVNVILYLPLGLTGVLTSPGSWHRRRQFIAAVLFGLALSIGVELAQIYVPSRTTSMADVICNALGTALGAALASLVPRRLESLHLARIAQRKDAILLATIWLGWQVYPLWPLLKRVPIQNKFTALTQGSLITAAVLTAIFGWMLAGEILELLVGYRWAPYSLIFLWPLLPIKLLLYGRTLTLSEVVGTAMGFVAFLGVRRLRQRALVVAFIGVATIVVREMVPFAWTGSAVSFSWIPFAASFGSEQLIGFLIVIEKALVYGGAVWLLALSGIGLISATGAISGLLLVLELVQTHMTNRSPEITDAVLTLIVAVCLLAAKNLSEKQYS